MATRCKVTFITGRGFIGGGSGPAAILWDRHGHALNAMNYPRGHRFTKTERARARKLLMAGCAELSREMAKSGQISTDTLARQRGLAGKKRRR